MSGQSQPRSWQYNPLAKKIKFLTLSHSALNIPIEQWEKRMRLLSAMALALTASACSLSDSVQRINVDYNYALEGITNELTLLNVVRAKEGLPLHYTSVQRLSGSITLKGTGGINASIKAGAPTDTISSTTAAAPAGTTLTGVVSRAVASGGNVYTPTIGAEVDTGPSFDVNILDSQTFYQGILASIPFSTITNFQLQDYDSKWLISLLAEQIEFRLKQATPGYSKPKGTVLRTIRNTATAGDTGPDFARLISCYDLSGSSTKPIGTPLAPASRVTGAPGHPLTMQDLALLDGTKLDLSAALSSNPAQDSGVTILRPGTQRQLAQLSRSPDCTEREQTINGKLVALPPTPPAEPPYVGSGQVMVLADNGRSGILVDADITVMFRSTEGLIQFIGRCLDANLSGPVMLCKVGDQVLFELRRGSSSDALISTAVLGQRYFIANDEYRKQTMAVIALIERLVNLQKSSTDRPVTVPVQVVQ